MSILVSDRVQNDFKARTRTNPRFKIFLFLVYTNGNNNNNNNNSMYRIPNRIFVGGIPQTVSLIYLFVT